MKIALLFSIIILYFLKSILELEFLIDAYIPIAVMLGVFGLLSVNNFQDVNIGATAVYFFVIHISMLIFLLSIQAAIYPGFFEGYFIYFLQPFVLWLGLTSTRSKIDPDFFLKVVSYSIWISLIGATMYYINAATPLGYADEIFKLEFAGFGTTLVPRNTSIYGNSLVAGGVGLIQMCSAAILFYRGRSKYIVLVFISFLFICTTLSRRAMIAGLVVFFFLYLISSKTTKQKILIVGLVFSIFLIIFSWEYLLIIFDRFLSSFDFSEENTANTSRLILIFKGFEISFSNILGAGFGNLSSLGKEVGELNDSVYFLTVTESLYTTFIGEIGIILSIPIIFLIYASIIKKGRHVRLLLIYPFIVESIMGLSLMNPMINFMFFLIYFSLNSAKNKNFQPVKRNILIYSNDK